MRRLLLLAAAALVAALLLGACASPRMPQKTSDQDCIVAIRTAVVNDYGDRDAFILKLYVSNYKHPITLRTGKSYVFIKVQQPGEMLTKLTMDVDVNQGYVGKSTSRDLDIELPYRAGALLVANVAVYKTIAVSRNNLEHWVDVDYGIRTLGEAEVKAIGEELRKEKQAAAWD